MQIRALIQVFILCFSFASQGNLNCKSLLLDKTALHVQSKNFSQRVFHNVKVYLPGGSRPTETLHLSLDKWRTVDFKKESAHESVVGITSHGEVYHVVHFAPGKTIARKLGMDSSYKDFIYTDTKDLIVLDEDGRAYLYDASLWRGGGFRPDYQERSRKIAIKATLATFFISKLLFSSGGIQGFIDFQGYELLSLLVGSSILAMRQLYRYENLRFVESFIPIDWNPDSGQNLNSVDLKAVKQESDLELRHLNFQDIEL